MIKINYNEILISILMHLYGINTKRIRNFCIILGRNQIDYISSMFPFKLDTIFGLTVVVMGENNCCFISRTNKCDEYNERLLNGES